MDKLVEFIARFVYRDLIFVLGGLLVFLSLGYEPGVALRSQIPTSVELHLMLVVAAFAWVAGYLVQDTAEIVGLVGTSLDHGTDPSWLSRLAYHRFIGSPYVPPTPPLSNVDGLLIQGQLDAQQTVVRERTVGFLMAGACLGPSALLSAIVILCKSWPITKPSELQPTLFLLVASLLLLLHARVKLLQLVLLTAEHRKLLQSRVVQQPAK